MSVTINGVLADREFVSSINIDLRSMEADRCSIRVKKDYDAGAEWNHGTEVAVAANGALFRGKIVGPNLTADGSSEDHEYTAYGPWHDLERLVFEQDRYTPDEGGAPELVEGASVRWSSLSTTKLSRVVLGADKNFALISLKDQITEVLTFARDRGVNLSIGTISVDGVLPWEELVDVTCAEVIRRALRYIPDSVAWFDYTTVIPVIHIRRLGSLPVFSKSATSCTRVNFVPRHDLQVPGCRIRYEKPHVSDGVQVDRVIIDEDGTPDAVGAVVVTIPLSGSVREFRDFQIEATEPDPNSTNWWAKLLPWINDESVEVLSPPGLGSITAEGGAELPEDVIYAITRGAIPEWALDVTGPQSGKVASGAFPVMNSANHNLTPIAVPVEAKAQASFRITYPDGERWEHHNYKLRASLVMTNLPSGRYVQQVSYDAGEPLPSGIAATFWDATKSLRWQGGIAFLQDECSEIAVGRRLNVLGGLSEWSSMNAMISGVRHELMLGETVIECGPPRWLSPNDLIEILRHSRTRKPIRDARKRRQGVELPGRPKLSYEIESAAPRNYGQPGPGGHMEETTDPEEQCPGETWNDATGRTVFDCHNRSSQLGFGLVRIVDGDKTANVDLTALPAGIQISFRQVDWCEGGVEKTAYVLMSVPS